MSSVPGTRSVVLVTRMLAGVAPRTKRSVAVACRHRERLEVAGVGLVDRQLLGSAGTASPMELLRTKVSSLVPSNSM